MHTPETELHERGLRARLHERSVGICRRFLPAAQLRHTLRGAGVDVKSVSELLGHADVRTTLRLYVHSSMDYKRRAVEGIGFLKGIT